MLHDVEYVLTFSCIDIENPCLAAWVCAREAGRSQAADGHLIVAAASAKESDTIALEKHKLARVQQNERKWLQAALGSELKRLRDMEAADQRLSQESADGEKVRKGFAMIIRLTG